MTKKNVVFIVQNIDNILSQEIAANVAKLSRQVMKSYMKHHSVKPKRVSKTARWTLGNEYCDKVEHEMNKSPLIKFIYGDRDK